MIDSKELRIGNVVGISLPESSLVTAIKGIELFYVKGINTNGTLELTGLEYPRSTMSNCSFAEPVRVTPDILLGCGFEEKKEKQFSPFAFPVIPAFEIELERYYIMVERVIISRTPYLHQLQNFYHCLYIGRELTISV